MKHILSIFRITAILEGISFLVLLGIAMPLKYYFDQPEPVRIIGMAHGVLFVLYVIFLLIVHLKYQWKISTTIWAFIASFLPFGTFIADYKIFRLSA